MGRFLSSLQTILSIFSSVSSSSDWNKDKRHRWSGTDSFAGEEWGCSVGRTGKVCSLWRMGDTSVSFMPPSVFSSGLPLRIAHAHVTLRQQSQTLRLKPRGVYETLQLSPVSRSFNPSNWQSDCWFGRWGLIMCRHTDMLYVALTHT